MSAPAGPELHTFAPRRGLDAHRPVIVAVLAGGGVGLWAGTQYVAHRLAYHPNLGPAFYTLPAELRGILLAASVTCGGAALAALLRSGLRRYAPLLALVAAALWVVRLGPLYSPFRFLRWSAVYGDIPELAGIVSDGVLVVGIATLAVAAALLLVAGSGPRRTASASHGTARWGGERASDRLKAS